MYAIPLTINGRGLTRISAVALTAALLAACASNGTESGSSRTAASSVSSTASPPPTNPPPATDATSSNAPARSVAPRDNSIEPWSMDAAGPGTFHTAVMEPSFTLTYGEGWRPFMPESRNQLNIELPESSELGCAPCALLGIGTADADTPQDIVELASSNGVELSNPVAVDVGGVNGERYDVVGGAGVILESGEDVFGVDSARETARFTILQVGGRVIVIHELAMPAVAETLLARTADIIASIEWVAASETVDAPTTTTTP